MNRQPIIGIIGGGTCSPKIAGVARAVGEEVAVRKGMVVCGGLGGVMEAACQGAHAKGGTTIGLLPGCSKASANAFVDIVIPTGMGDARNIMIIRTADAVIAIDGEYGTLSEIAFCLKFKVPVVGLATWDVDPRIQEASTPKTAVEMAFDLL